MFLKAQGRAVIVAAGVLQLRGVIQDPLLLLHFSHLICLQRCSQTQSLPQVVSALIVTDFVDPSELLGGPTQSLTSFQ